MKKKGLPVREHRLARRRQSTTHRESDKSSTGIVQSDPKSARLPREQLKTSIQGAPDKLQGKSKKEMKGRASDKEELRDRETGERKEKSKEIKAPAPPSTTVPIYQGLRLKNPLGEAGN